MVYCFLAAHPWLRACLSPEYPSYDIGHLPLAFDMALIVSLEAFVASNCLAPCCQDMNDSETMDGGKHVSNSVFVFVVLWIGHPALNARILQLEQDRVWPIITNLDALAVSESWIGHPGTLHLDSYGHSAISDCEWV